MISPAGMIWGVIQASYIYAIVHGTALYIGETGDLPAKRWGQHLADQGTLTTKTNMAGISLLGPAETLFMAVRCSSIEAENPQYRKLARRAVEEEVHRQFQLDSRVFGSDFQLLSTPPSPPIRYTWSFDTVNVAKMIHSHFSNQYMNWKQLAR